MNLHEIVKKLNRLLYGKEMILLAVLSLILITLPAIATYKLMAYNDRVEQKRDEYVSEKSETMDISAVQNKAGKNEATQSEASRNSIDIADGNQEPSEEGRIEKENNVIATLTSAHKTGTPGDADTMPSDVDDKASDSDNKTSDSDITPSDEDATPGDAAAQLNGKKVYLTFDDGPSDYTEELLDILDRYDVKATFFVVTDEYKHEDGLKKIVDRGHSIGLHSYSHIYSEVYADLDSFINDVESVHDWVEDVTGVDTRMYRFPGGSSNEVSSVSMDDCIDYLHDHGYEYYDWNAESGDTVNLGYTKDQLVSNVLKYVRNNQGNSTVLMHDLDDHYNMILALPEIIETLQGEGYEICPIDETTVPVQHRVPADEEETEDRETEAVQGTEVGSIAEKQTSDIKSE